MYYEYKVKKLYNGFASVRDFIIERCIRENQDLVIDFEGKKMGVPLEHLKKPYLYQIHRRKFQSKFKEGQSYELYDVFFVKDRNIKKKV